MLITDIVELCLWCCCFSFYGFVPLSLSHFVLNWYILEYLLNSLFFYDLPRPSYLPSGCPRDYN